MALTSAQLSDYFNSHIKKNGRQQITGSVMNYALHAIKDYIDAIPSSNIGTADLLITSAVRKLKLAGGTADHSWGVYSTTGSIPYLKVIGNGDVEVNYRLTVQGRVVVGYSQAGLGSTWGHTFSAVNGADKAFSVGNYGLSSSLLEIYANGQWQIGYLAGLNHVFSYNGYNHTLSNTNNRGLLIGGTDIMVSNSILELRSTTAGLVHSRLTSTQVTAMGTSLTESTTLWNTTTKKLQVWNGTIWENCN